jgi:hypothetical protein
VVIPVCFRKTDERLTPVRGFEQAIAEDIDRLSVYRIGLNTQKVESPLPEIPVIVDESPSLSAVV